MPFFFYQLHPCCISAFPITLCILDVIVFSSAFKPLYMHVCVCVESGKRGLALSITKKQGIHTAYKSEKEEKKKDKR